MRDALVTAQRAADDLRAAANREAEAAVGEAETRAREIVHKAYAERETVRREVEEIRAEELRIRTRLRSLLGTGSRPCATTRSIRSSAPWPRQSEAAAAGRRAAHRYT